MSGFILHALKSVARAAKDFAAARPNARADPQCAVAPGHAQVEGMCLYKTDILTLPRVGKRPSKGRSLIQLSEVTVWSIWKLMWKSFIFLDLSRSVFTTSVHVSNPPAPHQNQEKDPLKQTRKNYLNGIFEKHV